MFEKEQESTQCLPDESTTTEETVEMHHINYSKFSTYYHHLNTYYYVLKQADSSKAKTKVWQNKSKGAKKTAKSKKKKLTKKKTTPAPAKTKQANGNVAGNVRIGDHRT